VLLKYNLKSDNFLPKLSTKKKGETELLSLYNFKQDYGSKDSIHI